MQLLKTPFLILLSVLAFASGPSIANAQTPCHLLTSADPIPGGFGAAYNLFSSAKEVLLKVACDPPSKTVFHIGNGEDTLYIYRIGYEWTGSSWRAIALNGQRLVGDWYIGSAAVNLPRSEAQLAEDGFVVAYTCFRNGSQWRCGCREETCRTSSWQLQPFRYSGSTGGPAGGQSQVEACTGPIVNVTPGNILSTLNNHKNAVLQLEPGTYGRLSFSDKACIKLACTVPAIVNGAPNTNGCRFTAQIRPQKSTNIAIENMVFIGDNSSSGSAADYGVIIYQVDAIRIANNVFNGRMNHDISTKERVKYAEVTNNVFIKCMRHCIEVGQNGNVPSRPSTSDTMIVRGNVFDNPLINGITQRYNRNLIIDGNEFRNAGGNAVHNWPFWKEYDYGQSGGPEKNLVPTPPLRTEVTNNKFAGSNKLKFVGRGVHDDTVLINGNSGSVSCSRHPMDASTAAAHSNEQTTNPPKLDPASDVPC